MNQQNNNLEKKDEEEQQFIEYYETKNLDPFEKYQKKNVFPKRLVLQVLLVIFTTLQVKYYGIYQKDYRRFNINMWEDLLLEIDDEEQVRQEFYTVSAVSENLHTMVSFFQDINDNVIFTVLEPEKTNYYLFSYYENLKQDKILKNLKVEIDIDQGILQPFDYNNLEELKQYLIGVQRFTFYVNNLHSKFPVLGHICWDIQVHYSVESDFIVYASIDATQIQCLEMSENEDNTDEDDDQDGEQIQEIKSRRNLISDLHEINQYKLHSKQQKINQKFHIKNNKPIKEIDDQHNHYFDKLTSQQQYELLKEYENFQKLEEKKINYEKQFINKRVLNIVNYVQQESESEITSKSYQGQSDLIMLNIIVIILALVVFIFHFNRIYKGVKNYLGLQEVRKQKVMQALKKVKALLKKSDDKQNGSKYSKFEEVVEEAKNQNQAPQLSINQDDEQEFDEQPEKEQKDKSSKKINKQETFSEIQLQEIKKDPKQDLSKKQEKVQQYQENNKKTQEYQEEVKYLGQVHLENKNSTYPFLSFWVIFNSSGNFIQIMCSISLSFNQISQTLSDSNTESDDTFRELLLGLGCAFAWISLSEFLETLRDRRHDIFSYLMKNLLKAWFYNLVTVFPVFMAYTIIGTAFYWKSDFFENLTTSAITLFSIYHGDMISDFMYSVTDITESPLHSLYIISFTMLFAMFVYNMFTSVIGETREQLIKLRDEERKYKKLKEKQMRKLKKKQKLRVQQSIVTIQEGNESEEEDDSSDSDKFEDKNQKEQRKSLLQQKQQQQDADLKGQDKRLESIIRDKKDDQKIKRQESEKIKQKIEMQQEEDTVYEKLCDNLETKQITMEILLKEFDQIQNLMDHLNLKKEEKQKMYIKIIKHLENFQEQVEIELKESGNILLEQEQLIKNQRIIDE
ncbi:hypothetical protein PPERSA_05932 [Pseudocohnilembus persalinus]|uniref:Polycystin cation channel PKD1/PKD2 domain-containing protein n=1 Tax=Pseudocohnilembus persalinus TaxID=266149 RepID=A0A0V0R453_PSEPJ|nr:hypothetical protein PPERSA_05932 [Pseudocohnilembus persalinus]|eukprot:KRX09263.1 hypothetical protein PPERSA_05932 [Pseudocohnilembus persalinus]